MTAEMRQPAPETVHASPVAPPAFRRGLIIAALAGLFMALVGALGTDEAGLPVRIAYWVPLMLTGSALGTGVAFGVQVWGRLRAHMFAEGALVALLVALPLTAVVVGANQLAFDNRPGSALALAITFAIVLMVSSVMTAITYATAPAVVTVPAAAPVPVPAVPPPPRILARLPLHLRHARLLAIEAEDHYLRVHTDAGSDLILLRLVDAVAETDGLDGARCHRSWWVARAAVTAVERDGARTLLGVGPALRVPVSRSYLPELRAAGWLD
jgi:DNA-binding LytR/AlgR family response regulator